jgi:hypothetical protein
LGFRLFSTHIDRFSAFCMPSQPDKTEIKCDMPTLAYYWKSMICMAPTRPVRPRLAGFGQPDQTGDNDHIAATVFVFLL